MATSLINNEKDKNKFLVLYNTYKFLIFGISKDILNNNTHLAEEASQEVLIKLAKNINKINSIEEAKNYVIIITKHTSINILRGEKKYNQHRTLDEYESFLESRINLLDEVRKKEILKSIQQLPALTRDTLILKTLYGFSTKELADIFGITKWAVSQRLKRGRDELRKKL